MIVTSFAAQSAFTERSREGELLRAARMLVTHRWSLVHKKTLLSTAEVSAAYFSTQTGLLLLILVLL